MKVTCLMNKYKSLLINIGLFALNALATKLMAFILMPLYTLYFTSSEFGVMDMTTIVINLVFPVFTVSISNAVLRFVIDDKAHAKFYITEGLMVVFISCLIVFMCLPILNLSIFGGLGKYKCWFLISYIFCALQAYLAEVARAVDQIRLISISAVCSSLVMAGSAYIAIVLFKLGLIGYFISFIIGNVLASLIFMFGGKQWKWLSVRDWIKTRGIRKELYRYALPLAPNTVGWYVGTTFSRFLITGILGVGFSGLYAAASRIPNMLNALQQIFSSAWQVSSFQEYKKKSVEHFYSVIWSFYLVGMSLGSSVIILLSNWLASILMQKNFYNAWTLIPVLVFAFFVDSINNFQGIIFQAKMKTKSLMMTTLIGAAVCVTTTALTLNSMGIMGACFGVVIGNIAILIIRGRAVTQLMAVNWHYPMMVVLMAFIVVQVVMVVFVTTIPYIVPCILCVVQIVFSILFLNPYITSHRNVKDK